jgi:hypothetical protein
MWIITWFAQLSLINTIHLVIGVFRLKQSSGTFSFFSFQPVGMQTKKEPNVTTRTK